VCLTASSVYWLSLLLLLLLLLLCKHAN